MSRIGSKIKPLIAHAIERLSPRLWLELRLLRHDRHFEPEIWLTPQLIRRHSVVIDVGANAGEYTVYLAKFADAVHAFEPNPLCLQRLRRVKPRNAVLHPLALADREGEGLLRFDPGNTGLGTLSRANPIDENPDIREIVELAVPTARLDRLTLGEISLIKIDVEGFEEAVVTGCEGLLERMRPSFLIEIEERHNPGGIARLADWFDRRGYRGLFLDEGEPHPIARFDPQTHQRWGGGSRYINNFFFICRGTALKP